MSKSIGTKVREIVTGFIESARSLNRERDSYYYVTAGSAAGQILSEGGSGEALKFLCTAIGFREMLRGLSWFVADNAYVPIGSSGHLRDHKAIGLNTLAFAALQFQVCSIGYNLVTGHPWPGADSIDCVNAALLGGTLLTFQIASLGPGGTGLSDIPKSYSESMWNYPGKLPVRSEPQEKVAQLFTADS